MKNTKCYNATEITQCQQFLSELDTNTLDKLLEHLYEPSVLKRAIQNELNFRLYNSNNLGPTFIDDSNRILDQIIALQNKFEKMNFELREILGKHNDKNSTLNSDKPKKIVQLNIPTDNRDL